MKLIEGSKTDYITPSGKIYKDYGNNKFFQKSIYQNKHNGYMYVGITYPDGNKSRRHHVLLAKAFIPNPNNFLIVGHLDNDKTNNSLKNLYWTTTRENTQKAFDDGLIKNDKGYEDSQSNPVYMYSSLTRKLLGDYGSVRECSRQTGYSMNHIIFQAKNTPPTRHNVYFRFQQDGNINPPNIVIQYDYDTDNEIGRFYNTSDASIKTGISPKTISNQCNKNRKPKYKYKNNCYFLRCDNVQN